MNNEMSIELNNRDREKREAEDEGMNSSYEVIKLNLEIEQKMNRIEEMEGQIKQLSTQNLKRDKIIQEIDAQRQSMLSENQQLKEQILLLK